MIFYDLSSSDYYGRTFPFALISLFDQRNLVEFASRSILVTD